MVRQIESERERNHHGNTPRLEDISDPKASGVCFVTLHFGGHCRRNPCAGSSSREVTRKVEQKGSTSEVKESECDLPHPESGTHRRKLCVVSSFREA